MSRSTERERKEKKEEKKECCHKCKVPLSLYNAEYLVFLIIPEGWIGTLGLGEDVWRIRCQELLYFHHVLTMWSNGSWLKMMFVIEVQYSHCLQRTSWD